jgi:putative transposase
MSRFQFIYYEWIELLEKEEIKISIDGKGRAIDNIFIERF